MEQRDLSGSTDISCQRITPITYIHGQRSNSVGRTAESAPFQSCREYYNNEFAQLLQIGHFFNTYQNHRGKGR